MSKRPKPTKFQAYGVSAIFLLKKARREAKRRKAKLHMAEMRRDYPELMREQGQRRLQRSRAKQGSIWKAGKQENERT